MKGKKPPLDLSTMVYGKVPPKATDLELAILGTIMLNPSAFDKVASILKAESFYDPANQRVYKAMTALSLRAQPIDAMTIREQLLKTEEFDLIGGFVFLTTLLDKATNATKVETYARIVQEKFLKREQIRICGEGISAAFEDATDAFETLDRLSHSVTRLATIGTSEDSEDMATLGVKRIQYLEDMRHRDPDEVIGVPTGFKNIDKITRGWIPGYLIILAARPSVGKTALALNLGRNAAADKRKPTPVYFVSLEMSKENLFDRMISAESGIAFEKIIEARLTDAEMEVVQRYTMLLSNYQIQLEYCPGLNIIELRAKIRRWLAQIGRGGLVIVDYLQLMTGVRDDLNSQNREQEIANISRSLKVLAGELQVPIIALSQMSRDIEKRGGGKAKLSDLRESGAIEQDADVVAFLTRADYEMAEHEVTDVEKDKALIDFKKNRQGKLDVLPMRTALEIQKWMTPEQYNAYKENTRYDNLRPIRPLGKTGTDDDLF